MALSLLYRVTRNKSEHISKDTTGCDHAYTNVKTYKSVIILVEHGPPGETEPEN